MHKIYSIFYAATYDVQDPHVESLGGGEINVTGNFINNSRAVGCFLAIQCNITTEIRFIALKRRDREQVVSEVLSLPSSNYTVYAHDLEEGAVINTHPANLDPDNVPMVTVTGACKYMPPLISDCEQFFVFVLSQITALHLIRNQAMPV